MVYVLNRYLQWFVLNSYLIWLADVIPIFISAFQIRKSESPVEPFDLKWFCYIILFWFNFQSFHVLFLFVSMLNSFFLFQFIKWAFLNKEEWVELFSSPASWTWACSSWRFRRVRRYWWPRCWSAGCSRCRSPRWSEDELLWTRIKILTFHFIFLI